MSISPSDKKAKSELCEEQETHLLRLYGQSIAKDLGEINREFGYPGVSQAMKLIKDYLLKCKETGEAIEICEPDAINKINVWKKNANEDWSAKPKPHPEDATLKTEPPSDEDSDEDVQFQGLFRPKLPKPPGSVEVKPQEPFVIVSTKDKIPMKDIARSVERPRTPDKPPHLRGTLHTPEGQSVPPPLEPVRRHTMTTSRIVKGLEDIRVSLQSRMDSDANCDAINAEIADSTVRDIDEAVLIEAAMEAEDGSAQGDIEDDILAAIEE